MNFISAFANVLDKMGDNNFIYLGFRSFKNIHGSFFLLMSKNKDPWIFLSNQKVVLL